MADREYWQLTVDFRVTDDPERQFPTDDVSNFVTFLGEYFGTTVQELTEFVHFRHASNKVAVQAQVIDVFNEILPWVVMHTLPERLLLDRHEETSDE